MTVSKTIRFMIALLSLGGYGTAWSAPLYYTFAGTYDSHQDLTGQSASWGDFTNAGYSMIVALDSALEATVRFNDGSIFVEPDRLDNGFFMEDFVFAEMVHLSGFDVVAEINGGFFNGPSNVASFNVGRSRVDTNPGDGTDFTLLRGIFGSEDKFQNLACNFDNLATLVVGSSCTGQAAGNDERGNVSFIKANLELTSISDSLNPVPVPAAVWLFGSALIGLVAVRRRATA